MTPDKSGDESGKFVWQGLDHIQLAIPPGSEDICRQFYGVILGWEELKKPTALAQNGGLWFQAAGIPLHLGVDKAFIPAQKAHPAFLISPVTVLAKRLELAGYPVKWDRNLPGYKRFYSEDAVGNRLEFMQQLG
ncbi:glyoxalase [Kiloniella laminariae]|uniref:Glyoxalase n=1 Tax=Kiloniella laminariae TaxID=454162 RepID=A0ABT4LIX8_9PROT|nr:glyoxalase [Kiloniella laminariae]MCZ4281031.1 glyoxalase [Kiloniella laminariae]